MWYIEETGRNLQVRLREHQRHTLNAQFDRSAVAEHAHVSGHHANWDGASVLDYESNWRKRKVKEALHIRRQREIRPLINKDQGWHVGNVWSNVF